MFGLAVDINQVIKLHKLVCGTDDPDLTAVHEQLVSVIDQFNRAHEVQHRALKARWN